MLGTVGVYCVRWLDEKDEQRAMIECKTRRFGLELCDPEEYAKPVHAAGLQGIWNFKP